MIDVNNFYLLDDNLIYVTTEHVYMYGTKSGKAYEIGYTYIHLGTIDRQSNFFVIGTGSLSAWFNAFYYEYLDKPTNIEIDMFFNFAYKNNKEFMNILLNNIERKYPIILHKFPTLSKIRDNKIKELL